MILMVYNETMCREVLLPNTYNSDYILELHRETYHLSKDLFLHFENVENAWLLHREKDYQIKAGKDMVKEWTIKDRSILEIHAKTGDRIILVASDVPIGLRVMNKYDLSGMKEVSIGQKGGNIIQYTFFGLISGTHGYLLRRGNQWVLRDSSRNGIFCRNRRVSGEIPLLQGDRIDIFGLHIVFLEPYLLVGANCGDLKVDESILRPIPMEAEQENEGDERKTHEDHYFNRSPRNLPVIHRDLVEIDPPPMPKQEKQKPMYLVIGPAFSMAIPMMVGCLLMVFASRMSGRATSTFMYTGMVIAAGSAAIGAIWAFLNMKYSRESAAEDESVRFNAYSSYLIEIAEQLRGLYLQNTEAMKWMYPSARQCISYDQKSTLLWNRNSSHKDFLYQRIGLGDHPFQVEIKIPKEKFSLVSDSLQGRPASLLEEYKMLHHVPVGIHLIQHPLTGLVGGPGKKGAIELMHILTAGIAANHSYTDVKLVYIFDESDHKSLPDWDCMRWFPHVWSEDKSIRYMAANEMERRDVLFYLTNVVRNRAEQAAQRSAGKGIMRPHYVVFVQDPSLLEGELLAKYIYDNRPEYGLSVLLMTEELGQLPNVCEMIIENSQNAQSIYDLQDDAADARLFFVPDQIHRHDLESFGRKLSNIRVKENEVTSEIPSSLGFLEMYGVRKLEELRVPERWRKNRTYDSMKALIGKRAGNQDCYLDIHEKFHGPHGLVAGTTGSGKSETLQTYILSLAVNFSPEDISFFIIDFKGGGMANLFSDLPHLAGQISNLSGNQVNRAMISIKSENIRRQRIFAENGVNNINHYSRLYKEHRAREPIPHLFIIIDEFAELKREEPEFMQELISVAQVGRSLGVHLILATQKPGGTVDDNIQSNSKFRLCLRVQDRQDSVEMLHRPDAAYLTQAGRCYLQVGNDELFDLFQSGYSGAVYRENLAGESVAALLNRTGRAELVGNPRLLSEKKAGSAQGQTELEAVIRHLREVTSQSHYQTAAQLWLPVLKDHILLSEVRTTNTYQQNKWPAHSGKWEISAEIGILDDPERQEQKPLGISFSDGGHLAVCGSVVSGKSTFLQTLIFSLITGYSPDYLQLYLMDFSSHMLVPFANAPHVGGVVTDRQEDRLEKLFFLLSSMMDARRERLHGGNYMQYVQANGVEFPAVFIVLDNYASFREKTGDRYEKELFRLVREGVGYGMYLIISAGGFGMSEIPVRMADQIRTVVSLEQPDKYKYMEVMRLSNLSVMPETNRKGRGLAFAGDRILEFQTALCMEADDDFSRGQQIEELSTDMASGWTGGLPARIPEIPEKPTLDLLREDNRYLEALSAEQMLPIGYREKTADIYSIRLPFHYCMVITGKARSGKTNILRMMLYAAADKGIQTVVVESPQGDFSELYADAQKAGARYVSTSALLYQFFSDLMPIFAKRNQKKQALLKAGYDEAEVAKAMWSEPAIMIFVADLAAFFHMVYQPGEGVGNMSGFVENIMEKGRLHNIYFVGCLKNEDSSLLMAYKAYHSFVSRKQGIHAGGNLTAQKIFQFQNIAFAEQSKGKKKGFVYISDDEEEDTGIELVIPLVKQKMTTGDVS